MAVTINKLYRTPELTPLVEEAGTTPAASGVVSFAQIEVTANAGGFVHASRLGIVSLRGGHASANNSSKVNAGVDFYFSNAAGHPNTVELPHRTGVYNVTAFGDGLASIQNT